MTPMAKKLHPLLDSAYGVRVGDRVEKRRGSLDGVYYGAGEVLEIRSGYTNESGIRARIKRDPDSNHPNQPAIVLWDVSTLTVLQRAPGERVEGHPEHIPELPAPLVDPIDRLQHELKELKARMKRMELREEMRQKQLKDATRILRQLADRIDLHNRIIDQDG